MGISLFRKKERPPPEKPTQEAPTPAVTPARDGVERKSVNEWAKQLQVNEVQAERAAMRVGRWHDLFTEQEFLELIKKQDA